MMDLSKNAQLKYRAKKPKRVKDPTWHKGLESELQAQVEEMLDKANVEWRRFPEQLFSKIRNSGLHHWCSMVWKDKPDLLLMVPVDGKDYGVYTEVELKRATTDPNPRQAKYAERGAVAICRSLKEVGDVLARLYEVARNQHVIDRWGEPTRKMVK